MLEKTDKRVKVKGKSVFVVREQYLRNDIKCFSPLCTVCFPEKGSKDTFLDKNLTHYVIPCFDIVHQYLEILEISSLTGVIVLQSIASKVLCEMGRRHYERFIGIGRDSRRGSAVFLNEICRDTHVPRLPSDSLFQWLNKTVEKVAEYYHNHLRGAVQIIIISETQEILQKTSGSSGIEYLSLKLYLEKMRPDLQTVAELYNSISSSLSLNTVKEDSAKMFSSYLPNDMLEMGIKSGRFFKGFLRVNKHQPSVEAFVSSSKSFAKDSGDILISGIKDRNRAIHGDEVIVEILPKNQWKSRSHSLFPNTGETAEEAVGANDKHIMSSGKVVGIFERQWRDYVASLPEDDESGTSSKMGSERLLVIPYDYRIPKIRIPTRQASQLRNQRIVVRIDSWEKDSQYPNGHFVKVLGNIGDLETEIQSLLVEHSIFMGEFPQCLDSELPKSTKEDPWKVKDTEIIQRRDLRKEHLVFSIDPIGCEDVDDALSVSQLGNGNTELGVHIADVTFFVPPSSLTDLEARSRSTSVYLPDRRYDMLPHVLSGDICSLWGNVDRYAVSVMWEMDEHYEVKNVWYGRTVVRSKYKMTYEAAQGILSGKCVSEVVKDIPELKCFKGEELEERFSELKNAIFKLEDIYRTLNAKRRSDGGLELSSTNFKFEVDNQICSVTGIKPSQELLIHKIVAECMIFANEWVARKISETFPLKALLRRHPNPREADLKDLQKLALSTGYYLEIGSNKELAESLKLASDPNDPSVHQIFLLLATHSMNQATYFCTGCFSPLDFYHYGLGLEKYTHFTSPIRRYADVLVHRLLLAAVNSSTELLKSAELEELCEHLNFKHRAARDIEKATQEVFQTMYFNRLSVEAKDTSNCLVNAVIYSLKMNGVLVFIPIYGIKGAVCLCNKEKKVAVVKENVEWVDGCVEMHENHIDVKTSDCIQSYSIFCHITVSIRVQKSRAHNDRLVFDLVKNEPFSIQLSESVQNKTAQEKELDIIKNSNSDTTEVKHHKKKNDSSVKKCVNLYEELKRLKALTLLPSK